jgi:hypothetical protein
LKVVEEAKPVPPLGRGGGRGRGGRGVRGGRGRGEGAQAADPDAEADPERKPEGADDPPAVSSLAQLLNGLPSAPQASS